MCRFAAFPGGRYFAKFAMSEAERKGRQELVTESLE